MPWNRPSRSQRLLREVWRVLADGGQALIVVPNRRGLWCLSETHAVRPRPAVQRRPSSRRRCAATCSRPAARARALFVPPSRSRLLLRTAMAWERIGPALGQALRRRAADGRREADLRRCRSSPPSSAARRRPMRRCRGRLAAAERVSAPRPAVRAPGGRRPREHEQRLLAEQVVEPAAAREPARRAVGREAGALLDRAGRARRTGARSPRACRDGCWRCCTTAPAGSAPSACGRARIRYQRARQ